MNKVSSAALLLVVALPAGQAATRPHYGGTLRIEMREAPQTQDPPALLGAPFRIVRWEAGHRALYEADDAAPGGRPFVDSVEVTLGRPLRDQSIDLELGKADVVQLGPSELRRQPATRKVWNSPPVRVLMLVFSPRMGDARIREALALAVDRSAIHAVLFQRQGEVSGALLPQWLSGYAFLFPSATDLPRARSLAAGARPITLAVEDPAARAIAERIALNARDAGLVVAVTTQPSSADVRLTEMRISSTDPAKALASAAAQLGSDAPRSLSVEGLYAAERALLDGFRVIPLLHLPDVYGVSNRVRGGTGLSGAGEWQFENLWLEGLRP